jgi:hypothetical protein
LNALDFLKESRLYVWPGHYSVVKAQKLVPDCFASLVDQNEITLVQKSEEVDRQNVIAEEKNWRILTFEAVLPFELTGFLAAVAGVLAEAGIPIFALSAYSTDHILVKDAHLEKSIQVLSQLGVSVKQHD